MKSNIVSIHNVLVQVCSEFMQWSRAVCSGLYHFCALSCSKTSDYSKITELQDGLSWKRPYHLITPLPWAEIPFPRPGCSGLHPAWSFLCAIPQKYGRRNNALCARGKLFPPYITWASLLTCLHRIPITVQYHEYHDQCHQLFTACLGYCILSTKVSAAKQFKGWLFWQYCYSSIVWVSNYLLSSILNPRYIQEA